MAEEREQTYFICGRESLPRLIEKAEAEAEKILAEFSEFFNTGGKLGIKIEPVEHGGGFSYSVAATLTWNGKPLQKRDDPCDLLFLQLNNAIISRMIQLRRLSRGEDKSKSCPFNKRDCLIQRKE